MFEIFRQYPQKQRAFKGETMMNFILNFDKWDILIFSFLNCVIGFIGMFIIISCLTLLLYHSISLILKPFGKTLSEKKEQIIVNLYQCTLGLWLGLSIISFVLILICILIAPQGLVRNINDTFAKELAQKHSKKIYQKTYFPYKDIPFEDILYKKLLKKYSDSESIGFNICYHKNYASNTCIKYLKYFADKKLIEAEEIKNQILEEIYREKKEENLKENKNKNIQNFINKEII